MAKKLKLGIIGMSEGNGHPYSWSAIFNGYNAEFMQDCPFPAIPDYLSKQNFPEAGLGSLGKVTHIWTQDPEVSKHIAQASKIENIVQNMDYMIGEVDAILLARDDADRHSEMAEKFIKAGIPIFIDKPFALTLNEAERMLNWRVSDSQIFTCSALRFANELILTKEEKLQLGEIVYIEASISKNWDTYAIHLLEPIVAQMPERGDLKDIKSITNGEIQLSIINWDNLCAYIKTTGSVASPLSIQFFGTKANVKKSFSDSFSCFRISLQEFIKQIHKRKLLINLDETLELVKILEWGKK